MWYKKAYCKNSVSNGLRSIKGACIKILYKNLEKKQPKVTGTETNNFDSKALQRNRYRNFNFC
jgi:hypothetical protein